MKPGEMGPGADKAPGRALVARLPSTDLFFADAMADCIARPWRPRAPIRSIGRNAFVCGETMLLIRRDAEAIMRAALGWRGRLLYFIDDDIAGGAENSDLPAAYRRRLTAFDHDFHAGLLARADVVIAASDVLADRLAGRVQPGAPIRRIDPFWREPLPDQRHYEPLVRGGAIHLAHLGSASHRGGLAALAPALAGVLRRHATLRFTYIAPVPALGGLDADRRVVRIAPKRWPRYRHWLARQRFHLALYPLTDSRFDRARSANKLREHALCGAVGVYPADWLYARAMTATSEGALFAPADPGAWEDGLEQAIARRSQLAHIAACANRTLSCHDDRARQRQLWAALFNIAPR